LRKVRVLVQHLGGGDIVNAGVSKNIVSGTAGRNVLAVPTDHDAELAFKCDLAPVRARPFYRLTRTGERSWPA
jgi:hypothetical protein